ncbi:MAG: multicopper oxidase domain-containing protein [Acidobacteria bacterium]|nr:multicopper oxidase domain-containing protein [Acidobacteriota bacterium]
MRLSRRNFLKAAGLLAGTPVNPLTARAYGEIAANPTANPQNEAAADYTLRIAASPIEIAPNKILSTTTYNGQFPGPLLRFKEGRRVTVDIYNDTDSPEQLHWHGQMVPADIDGAAEEGTPFVPAQGQRRISFVPQPSGYRFYHTHNRAGADLAAGQYGGQVGHVYIEPRREAGNYDREVFLVLKEFEPTFSHGGDMPQDILARATKVKALEAKGESAMKVSLARGEPKGYEVGYQLFTINGRMLGHGDPVRVRQGERVLFHVLNGSATETRSVALPGHFFRVVAPDGNPVPNPAIVPFLWIGTGERVSALVKMDRPGRWIMGDTDDDDRRRGMGIVLEYAGRTGKAQWMGPPKFRWDYARFAKTGAGVTAPDETFELTFAKDNAAIEGFNRWTINGVAYSSSNSPESASFHLKEGRHYRIHMRNESDDLHPIHLHRHSFELTNLSGMPTSGVTKDVVMLGGYQEIAVDFVANNPGLTLFHCHQQLHMDFGFMTLFNYV